MLGIVNPGLVSVDEIRNKSTNFKGKSHYTVGIVDVPTTKENALPLAELVIIVEGKNHFESKCRSKRGSSKSESKHDSRRPSRANGNGKCSHKCRVHEVNEECHDDLEDLNEQVQSLFYS